MNKIKSAFRSFGQSCKEFFAGEDSIFRRFGRKVKQAVMAVVHGSVATKISVPFMGVGQMMRKQIGKGILYFLVEVAFILFMVFFGGSYIGQLFSGALGTKEKGEQIWNPDKMIFEAEPGDNSFLILLFGVVSLILLIMFIVVWVMNIRSNLENDRILKEGGRLSTFKEDCNKFINQKFYVTLLVLPLLGLLIFTIMPLIFMILIAFTNYDYEHTPPGALFTWVGFNNFGQLFSLGDSGFLLVFLRVFAWTIVWAFFATFTNYFLGMIVALMINKKGIKLKKLWRTLFVVAIAVPQFVTLLLMSKILDDQGILNVILGTNIRWLADASNAAIIPRVVIIVVNIWIGIPYTLLMCSGILMNIPPELCEAARLDGANPWQLFRSIILPYMLQVTGPYLITTFVGNINNFNIIWLLTGGGPIDTANYGTSQAQATDLLVTWLYRLTTGDNPRYYLASVIGIIIFIICGGISLIVYNRSNSTRNEEDFQ